MVEVILVGRQSCEVGQDVPFAALILLLLVHGSILSLSVTTIRLLLPIRPGVLLKVKIIGLLSHLVETRLRYAYLILSEYLIIQPILLLFLYHHSLFRANFVQALP